jgi:N-methylhydantoinase B
VEYEPVDTEIEALFTSDGTVNAPLGVRGGHEGAKAQQFIRRADGQLEVLDLCAHLIVKPGESLVSICTGAGGYGMPCERDEQRVLHDFEQGYISLERAENVYGIVISKDGHINKAETDLRRQKLSKSYKQEDVLPA